MQWEKFTVLRAAYDVFLQAPACFIPNRYGSHGSKHSISGSDTAVAKFCNSETVQSKWEPLIRLIHLFLPLNVWCAGVGKLCGYMGIWGRYGICRRMWRVLRVILMWWTQGFWCENSVGPGCLVFRTMSSITRCVLFPKYSVRVYNDNEGSVGRYSEGRTA